MAISPFRLQIYDDGAGEYVFDSPFNSNTVAGNMDTASGLPNGAVGPFILPSPLAVTKPGLMTVMMTNINAPANLGFATPNNIVAFVALVFAIPKKCRGQVPSIFKQQGRTGIIG